VLTIATEAGAVRVFDLTLACCSLESSAALSLPFHGLALSEEPPVAGVLCISGTISKKLVPALAAARQALAAEVPNLPVAVMAIGACAASGGPYWDAPSVAQGAHMVLGSEVDLIVPGCPPTPAAIAAALGELARSLVPA
jgi:NADH-quinone oxidoreductase subunit B